MKLQTPVADLQCRVGISYKNKITMLGSCFSDNIGSRLQDYGFDVLVNPFGTLYNPISIMQSVELLLSDDVFTKEDCMEMGAGSDLICSFSHHTSFARKNADDFLKEANLALEASRKHFMESDRVIITLGTSWCFRHIDSGKVVSNCLKRPGGEFTRVKLSLEETVSALMEIIGICSNEEAGKKKDIIFTVSPIRHFKDGAHGNQLSKATLLLGIDEAIRLVSEDVNEARISVDYFPAYEIMMDELRDYRYYAEDMVHPSQLAVKYIFKKFTEAHISNSSIKQMDNNLRLTKAENHIQK